MNFNFNNLTKDQRESVALIAILAFFAINCFVGAALIPIHFFIISVFLTIGGLLLLSLATVGYFTEFRGWDPKD